MWLLHLPLFFASVAGSPSVKFPKSSKANDPLTPADVLQEFQSRPPSGPEDLRRLFFRDAYPFWQPEPPVLKSGDPLILTPLLENGEIEEARRLSRVKLPNYEEEIESYSGFFNVDKAHNSNLFYWFFPSQQEDLKNEVPLLLWLQGGPGASSLIGLFLELGPLSVRNESGIFKVRKNEYTWGKEFSLLFIDQPVGTGFSFTDNSDGYAKNLTMSSDQLYDALTQFFAIHGDYEENPFYITGESYAGKFVPALASKIHQMNVEGGPKINLQGIAVGNGFTDPSSMLYYSKYLFQLGLIDINARTTMEKIEEYTKSLIESKQYILAFSGFSSIMKIFYTVSGFKTPYNYLKEKEDNAGPFDSDFAEYVQLPQVRQALHVGDTEFKSIGPVYWNLLGDFMKSGKPYLEEVMENYKVLLYSGQMDIICAYPLSVNLFKTLKFGEKEKYEKASRWTWYYGSNIAGYIKSSGRLTEALIRNSGHLCPADQPAWTLDLITRFTKDQLKPETDVNIIETRNKEKPKIGLEVVKEPDTERKTLETAENNPK